MHRRKQDVELKKLNDREFGGKSVARPAKGSQEAKDKMARLRTMRGSTRKTTVKQPRKTKTIEQLGGALNKETKNKTASCRCITRCWP